MDWFLISLACAALISRSNAWYTGPDGNIAVEGTPEHQANEYLKKILVKYGVDVEISDEMGEKMLAELMTNLGLGIIHKLPTNDDDHEDHDHHDHDDHGDDVHGDDDHGDDDHGDDDHGDDDHGDDDHEDDDHEDDDHDAARRRKKRSSDQPITVYSDSVSSTPHHHENISGNLNNTNCRSAPLLLEEYSLTEQVTDDEGIGSYEFGMLCPALIYMIDEKSCIEEYHGEEEDNRPTTSAVWGYGILSVTVISLLSILGICIVPLISASFFQALLSSLVAGAVGALSGDALLHLIPHSLDSSHSHSNEAVFKNLVVLGGIYLLFVVEGIMKICHVKKSRKRQKKNLQAVTQAPNDGDDKLPSGSGSNNCIGLYVYPNDEENIDKEGEKKHNHEPRPRTHVHEMHAHERHVHNHDHGDLEDKGIASMAWMVIAGDGVHNFSDGVAIGAAFSASLVGGLSTSIAVFCHELPHELGDFAMLVKSGMTIKQALLYNAVAASMAYLGLIFGILIGKYAASVTPWIFSLTAGMFLYVALVDMLPHINSGAHLQKTKSAVKTFLLQNIGLLVGMGIMLIISLFEEELELSG